jgi:hypothetical protein
MTKFVYIVYVHPVELGKPNLHKVKAEREFDTKQDAIDYIEHFNRTRFTGELEAVYLGCVNDATGELI